MKKKILHVQVIPQYSGVQVVSLDILKGLPDKYEKHIIFSERYKIKKSFSDLFESEGVKVHYTKKLYREIGFHDISSFMYFYRFLKENKFDIVHTNSTKPGIIVRVAARLAGVKLVVHTVHGISFHNRVKFLPRVIFYLVELVSCLFGHKNISVNNYYKRFYPSRIIPTTTIYNGVDFDSLSVNKAKSDVFRIGFFARLDEQKNPLRYVEIVDSLVNGDFDLDQPVSFVLAGDGALKEECLTLIKKLGLESVINFHGWIEDKSDFLNNIDLLCQPSSWEAFGLNFVEAAYFGIPSVTSRVEGIPEVVLDNQTGLLCENSIESYTSAIQKVINDKELYECLSSNCRAHVVKNFNVKQMVKEYVEVYDSGNLEVAESKVNQ